MPGSAATAGSFAGLAALADCLADEAAEGTDASGTEDAGSNGCARQRSSEKSAAPAAGPTTAW